MVQLATGISIHQLLKLTHTMRGMVRIHNENIAIKLPPLSNEPVTFPELPKRQHKNLKVLFDSDPFTLPG